ncbi:Mitochondrial-processing peptidase subunit alpha [Alternaria alternata]|nr:Mitochondrial-processing peptidase subunit alpha [Alternaria alternata]
MEFFRTPSWQHTPPEMLRPHTYRPLSRGLSKTSASLTRSAACTGRRNLATAVAEERVSTEFT